MEEKKIEMLTFCEMFCTSILLTVGLSWDEI